MKPIALFIDVDNLSIPLKEKGIRIDWDFIINIIKKEIEGDMQLAYARAYLDISFYEKNVGDFCRPLFEKGIEVIYSPRFPFKDKVTSEIKRKSLSDPMMICDIISTVYEMEYINNYVIVTSDKDFVPVVRMLVKKNKEVIVIGIKENGFYLSKECEQLKIPFIDYISKIKKN